MPAVGTRPGPDVIVGELSGLAQFGASSGTQVGLAVGTDSCNAGAVDLDWFSLGMARPITRLFPKSVSNERWRHQRRTL